MERSYLFYLLCLLELFANPSQFHQTLPNPFPNPDKPLSRMLSNPVQNSAQYPPQLLPKSLQNPSWILRYHRAGFLPKAITQKPSKSFQNPKSLQLLTKTLPNFPVQNPFQIHHFLTKSCQHPLRIQNSFQSFPRSFQNPSKTHNLESFQKSFQM